MLLILLNYDNNALTQVLHNDLDTTYTRYNLVIYINW